MLQEADQKQEEQGSSGGIQSKNSKDGLPQEEGYDADQTFMTMDSKEQENEGGGNDEQGTFPQSNAPDQHKVISLEDQKEPSSVTNPQDSQMNQLK